MLKRLNSCFTTLSITSFLSIASFGFVGCQSMANLSAPALPVTPVTAAQNAAPPTSQASTAPMVASRANIAAYIQTVRAMNSAEIVQETQRLEQIGTPAAHLYSALLLVAPEHPARDDARAAQIAEELSRSAASNNLRELAGLVTVWLADQQRIDGLSRRAQQKSRDDEKRINELEARLRESERRASEAEKKLEALQRIDREMAQRQAPAAATTPTPFAPTPFAPTPFAPAPFSAPSAPPVRP